MKSYTDHQWERFQANLPKLADLKQLDQIALWTSDQPTDAPPEVITRRVDGEFVIDRRHEIPRR